MNATQDPVNNTIIDVLVNQRKGALIPELSEKLQKLVQSVKEHNKGGSLVLTLKVSPFNGDASALLVVDQVELKVPKAPLKGSMFYSTDEGVLQRKDPNQVEMQLTVVESKPAAVPLVAPVPLVAVN